MAGRLQLRVVTPEKPIFEGQADTVVVPAHDGEIGILPRHARLLAALGIGELRVATGDAVQRYFVEGGFVQVRQDRVTVLCDRASRLEDASVAAAQAEADAARAAQTPEAGRLQQRAVVLRRITAHAAGAVQRSH